jgi:RNA polymerase sigma-70 factor (ECF subfamily)
MSEARQAEYIKLVQAHEGIIHKVVNLYVDDEEDRKDLCQEALLQAWKSFQTFQGNSSFSTWLYRVCLNTVLTYRKRENKLKEIIKETPIPEQPPDTSNADLLYYLVRQLNDIDRMLMSLHLDGYKNMEIAEITGMNQNHVNVKIYRLKERIIAQFKKEANGSI